MALRFKEIRFRHRGTLLAATIALQALVLGVGGWAVLSSIRAGVTERVEESVLAECRRDAENFLALARQSVPRGPVVDGTPAWERVQSHAESFSLPIGAQLLVLGPDGRVLCHPEMRLEPALRKVDLSEQLVRLGRDGELAKLGDVSAPSAVGVYDFMAGRSMIALVTDRDLGITVVVHQPEAGTMAAAGHVTGKVLVWAAASGVLLLGITILGSAIMLRKYDHALSRLVRQLEQEVERRTRHGLAIRNGLIFGLAKLADYRDSDTGRHLERICTYSALLARELAKEFPEIDDDWIDRLRLASSMHDIGKVGIPDSILLKPGGLTREERAVMEQHVLIGADTLIAIRRRVGDDDLLNMGIQVALGHHERYDGAGYPFGLKGDQAPLAARIVALADMYDALTSKRVYKDAMTHEQARAVIRAARGAHFDPRIVDAFERVHRAFDETRAELAPDHDVTGAFALHASAKVIGPEDVSKAA